MDSSARNNSPYGKIPLSNNQNENDIQDAFPISSSMYDTQYPPLPPSPLQFLPQHSRRGEEKDRQESISSVEHLHAILPPLPPIEDLSFDYKDWQCLKNSPIFNTKWQVAAWELAIPRQSNNMNERRPLPSYTSLLFPYAYKSLHGNK